VQEVSVNGRRLGVTTKDMSSVRARYMMLLKVCWTGNIHHVFFVGFQKCFIFMTVKCQCFGFSHVC